MLKKIVQKIYSTKQFLEWQFHRLSLRQKTGNFSQEYQQYLDKQLQRTVAKKANPLQLHARLIVNRLAELIDLTQAEILCIGCRNVAEIDYFRNKGASLVTGVDLFSSHPDIKITDMHSIDFPDNNFDIIYAAHSLEHSYDVSKVVKEIIRVARSGGLVAIEVPVQYKISATDLVDFDNLQNLHTIFEPHIAKILWSEHHPPLSPKNEQGTAIIRTIFAISK